MSRRSADQSVEISEESSRPSTVRRHKAANGIDQFGFEVMPCSRFTRIINEAKRLDQREAEAEELLSRRREALRQAQRELDESLSELESCRKRKRDLTKKGAEMTRRGLESLEELERAEQADVPSERVIIEDVNSLVHSDVLDLSFLDPSFFGESSSGVAGR
ncbi:hypothetical protein FBEOM_8335 [Fusarium beomiforme]|uniref:Uncharacterized protein n=1 Tax=Fusarium beomiforme TaxID=44412 RepID=A0A9P5DWX4_9HYPO|nr:hypothetical protein FBEOM_8335 [Fusarium beomiforme]